MQAVATYLYFKLRKKLLGYIIDYFLSVFFTYMDVYTIVTLCHTCVHVIFTVCIIYSYILGWRPQL